jgi:hypothetical protein
VAYVRQKVVRKGGREYHYFQVVEAYRDPETGVVRQRVLLHLGRDDPAGALAHWQTLADDRSTPKATRERSRRKLRTLRNLIAHGKLQEPAEDPRDAAAHEDRGN